MASLTIQSETTRVNFVDYIGDTIVLEFAYKSNGNLIDLTQVAIDIEIRKLQTDELPVITYSKNSGTVTSNNLANIRAVISDTETLALGPGEFYYFVKLTYPTSYVNTLIVGKLILKVR